MNVTCVPCVQGKLAKRPFKSSQSRSHSKLELIHSDLCGPMSTESWGRALYLLTFTDDYTRKTFGYLLKTKSEVFSKFVEFKHLVENQTGLKIKKFRSDNGREFVNHEMTTFMKENGIVHQKTVPYNPQQNGVAERVNRTVIEKARSMLSDANLPKAYWGEAVNTAI
jgi:transposase InsO family protein